MAGRTEFEVRVIAALQGVRDQMQLDSAYDGNFVETIVFNGTGGAAGFEDFGDGWSETIAPPTGYKGRVMGVSIYGITETFTNVTTDARVDVGTAADPDAYYTGGDIGAAAAATPANPAGTVNALIDDAADFVVTGVAPTGGTPAGRSRVAVTIAWIKE